jgi:magnesium transporter
MFEKLGQFATMMRNLPKLKEEIEHLSTAKRREVAERELRPAFRDVADHATRVVERTQSFRDLLESILTVNTALVGQRQNDEITRLTEASFDQNEQVKRISAWAAILFAPTLIGTVYGMNFTVMPELGWRFGYPFALALMAAVSVGLFAVFERRNWI